MCHQGSIYSVVTGILVLFLTGCQSSPPPEKVTAPQKTETVIQHQTDVLDRARSMQTELNTATEATSRQIQENLPPSVDSTHESP
jgi:PBP1b-binding outer membrane lipoprotein LpoB